MINGITELCLMKLDVLDEFDEIKIGVSYNINGEEVTNFSSQQLLTEQISVNYETYTG